MTVSYVADPVRWHFLLRVPGFWRAMFPVDPETDDATATSWEYAQTALRSIGHWHAIRLRQSKTGARVVIPAGKPLKEVLDRTAKRSPLILTNSDGRPWTPDGFRSSWRKACVKAGVSGVTFHDLRGTAVTRLAICGCTERKSAGSPVTA